MSTIIDDRVVQMEFDNSRFERNVSQSILSLEKLKQALHLEGSAEAFNDIDAAANRMDFSGIVSACDIVSTKFSALETIGIGALLRIGQQAVDTGEKIIKSLSIDQISAGWQKYADMTTSSSTLLSQGYEMDVVSDQLEKLNRYTDETSYNFTDMVSNISKFTAAGQDLDESVTAMEGIANWAALSGQNATTASRAMYQLSQAMGSGVMKRQDYMSVQNANMDTQEFRQTCLDAAVALGTLRDNADGTYTSLAEDAASADAFTRDQFMSSLTEGLWLTKDVMMKVFNTYSSASDAIISRADESGTLVSDEINAIHDKADELSDGVMSDTEATDAAIRELGYTTEDGSLMFDSFGLKALEAAQKARTFGDALDSVKDAASTGWMKAFQLVFGDAEEATELWTDLANGLYDVFASPTSEMTDLIAGWRDFDIGRSGKTADGRDLLFSNEENNFGAIYILAQNLVDALNLVGEAWSSIFPPATSKTLYELTKSFREFTVNMQEFGTAVGPRFTSVFRGAFAVVDIFWQGIKAVGSGVLDIVQMFVPLGDSVLTTAANFGEWLVQLDESIKETGIFQTAVEKVTGALEKIFEKISPLIDGAKEGFSSFFEIIGDGLSKIDGTPIFETLGNVFSTIGETAGSAAKVLKDIFGTLADNVNLPSIDSILVTAGEAGGVGIIWSIKKAMDSFGESLENIGKLGGISDILEGVKDSLEAWQKNIQADTIRSLAVSVGILAASLVALSTVDAESIVMPLGAIAGVLYSLIYAFDKFNQYSSSTNSKKDGLMGLIENYTNSLKQVKQAQTIVTFASAILIMAGALKLLSTIDTESMLTAMLGLTTIMGEMTVVLMILQDQKITQAATGLIAFGAAILIMAGALKLMSSINVDDMYTSILGLTIIMGEMTAVLSILQGNKVTQAATGLVAFGAAMLIMAGAMKLMSTIDTDSMYVAMLGLTTIMGEMTAVLMILQDQKITQAATGLVAFGAAILIMAGALKLLSTISSDEMVIGITGLTAIIVELVVAMTYLNGMTNNTLAVSASLILVATAITLLVPAIATLGALPLSVITQGILAIAAGLITIVGAATLAYGGVPALLAISAAFLAISASVVIFGVGLTAIGAGVASLAAGLAMLADLGPKVISGAYALSTALIIIVSNLITLLPTVIITAVTTLITSIISVISANIQQIVGVVAQLISTILTAIGELLPQIITLLTDTVSQILSALTELVPQFCDFVMTVITSVLTTIEENTQQIVETVVQIIIDILNGITNKLPDLIQAGVDLIVALIQGITQAQVQLIDAGVKCIIDFINGLADSIRENTPTMIDAVNNLMSAIIEAIAAWFENFITKGGEIVTKIGEGVSGALDTLTGALGTLLSNAISWVKDKASDWVEAGKNLVEGLADGVREAAGDAFDCVTSFGSRTLNKFKGALEEESPSKATHKMGVYLVKGFENGIKAEQKTVLRDAEDLSEDLLYAVNSANDVAIGEMQSSLQKLSALLNDEINFNPTITPLLDTSKLRRSLGAVNSLFDDTTLDGDAKIQNGSGSGSGNSYQFIQNNYSPKALSRVDIYRQTNNQFTRMKGLVETG